MHAEAYAKKYLKDELDEIQESGKDTSNLELNIYEKTII